MRWSGDADVHAAAKGGSLIARCTITVCVRGKLYSSSSSSSSSRSRCRSGAGSGGSSTTWPLSLMGAAVRSNYFWGAQELCVVTIILETDPGMSAWLSKLGNKQLGTKLGCQPARPYHAAGQ